MKILHALVAGTLFGIGLTVSGMVNPAKVLNFLDFAAIGSGGWDATLAVVFAAALTFSFLGVQLARRLDKPLAEATFNWPARSDIDAPLVAGAAVFGVGWGLVGVCPGPALTAVAVAGDNLVYMAVFVAAMVIGNFAAGRLQSS